MRKLISIISIFSLLIISSPAISQDQVDDGNVSLGRKFEFIQQYGYPLDLIPLLSAYGQSCGTIVFSPSSSIDSQLQGICEVTLQTPACEGVPEEDLRDCSKLKEGEELDPWEFLSACAEGFFDSVSSFLEFLWTVIKTIFKLQFEATYGQIIKIFDEDYETETLDQAGEYLSIAKQYLHQEYDRAYEEESMPFRKLKALKSLGGSLANLVISSVKDVISSSYQKFGCLNNRAQTQYTCQMITDIFFPPAFAIGAVVSLIKLGPKALQASRTIMNAVENAKNGLRTRFPDPPPRAVLNDDVLRMSQLDDAARRSQITQDYPNLNQQQVDAIMRAHNDVPCAVGTCSQSQLRQKALIMEQAGIDQATRRSLISRGVAGSGPTPEIAGAFSNDFPGLGPVRSSSGYVETGMNVSFPRTSGGRSNGVIQGFDGDYAIVTFQKNGDTYQKKVHYTNLRTPLDAGMSVSVPRTGGGYSNATITHVAPDGTASVSFQVNGQTYTKSGININELRPPFDRGHTVAIDMGNGSKTNAVITNIDNDTNMATVISRDANGNVRTRTEVPILSLQRPYNSGDSVLIPRSSGGYSRGTVTYIDNYGIAHVEFPYDTGGMATKSIHMENLRTNVPESQIRSAPAVDPPPRPQASGVSFNPSSPTDVQQTLMEQFARHNNLESRSMPFGGPPARKGVEVSPGSRMEFQYHVDDVAFARREGKIFENVKPQDLPEGSYTYVVTKDGEIIYGQVDNGVEFGVKHLHIAQGKEIVAAGEVRRLADGSVDYNFLSGTFMMDIVYNSPGRYGDDLMNNMHDMFRSMTNGRANYTHNGALLPDGPPSPSQWRRYCNYLTTGAQRGTSEITYQRLQASGVCP